MDNEPRFIYVLMLPAEIEVGSFAPLDACHGAFMSRVAAGDTAGSTLDGDATEKDRREIDRATWQPELEEEGDTWKLVHPDSGEVFAVVESVVLERRDPGDRRGR
jgi:hypothetical protein